jgi:hypothetical protein
MTTAPIASRTAPTQRQPIDFAVEFGGYLARAAERLMRSMKREDELRQQLEAVGDPTDSSAASTEQLLEEAVAARGECMSALGASIYEFGKRQARATQAAAGAAGWRTVGPTDIAGLAGKVVKVPDGTYDLVKGASVTEGVLCASGRRFRMQELTISEPLGLDAAAAHQLANTLRQSGFAVALFGPEELHGVDPEHVESRLAAEGNEIIEILKEPAASATPRA